MSKQFLGQSVWANFVSGITTSLGLRQKARRRPTRKTKYQTLAAQELETRVVPAAVSMLQATYDANTDALTLSAADGKTEEITVVAGTTYTDVSAGGVLIARVQGATSGAISTITLDTTDATDTLTVSGITSALTIDLNAAQSLTAKTGALTVTADGALTLGASTINGALTVTAGGDISDSGKLTVSGATTITAVDSTGPTDKNITLDTAGNTFGALNLTGASATITEAADTVFALADLSGALTITSTGNVSQTGKIEAVGATTITAISKSVTLTTSTNSFGALTITAKDINIAETGNSTLTTVTATGTLTLLSTGDISDTGKVTVSGKTALTAANISLDSISNTFGTLVITATGNVDIKENAATEIGLTSVDGTFGILSQGSILQTGVITAKGAATLNASNNAITLPLANSFRSPISLTGSNIALTNTDALVTNTVLGTISASGTLYVKSASDVVSSGANMVVAGAVTISAAGFDVTLTGGTDSYGTLNISGVDVTIIEDAAVDLGTITATGALVVTSTDAITDSGKLTVTGKATIVANSSNSNLTLDFLGHTFGSLQAVGDNVRVIESGDTALDSSFSKSSFSLTSSGAVTQADAVTLNGTASITATTAITLTDVDNLFGTLSLSGTTVSVTEDAATVLGTVKATTLTVVSDDEISGTGVITTTGDTTITAAAGKNITLSNTRNIFGKLVLTGEDVTIVESGATNLGALTVAGDLSITTTGAITNVEGKIDVAGSATLNAGRSNITVGTGTASVFGQLSLTGAAFNVTESDSTELGTVTGTALTLTSSGDVTQAASTKITLTGRISISTAGNDIVLQNDGNNFGSVRVTAAASAAFEEASNTELAGITLTGGALTVDTTGNVIDTAVTTATGTTINATENIVLDSYGSSYGAIGVTGKNVTLSNTTATTPAATAWDLAASTISGSLTVVVTDLDASAISDSGVVSVTGKTTFNAGTKGAITLSEDNSFGALTIIGKNVSINEDAAMEIASAKVSGTLTLLSTGNITQIGAIAAADVATITSNDAGTTHDITLNNALNVFSKTLVLTGDNISIVDASAVDLGATSADGTLAITSKGAIDDSGVITVDETASFNSPGFATTLDQANTFTGAVSFTAASVAVSNVAALTTGTTVATGNVSLTTTTGAIALGASTIGGTLTINSKTGVSEGGKLAITGTTTIAAGTSDDVALNTTTGHTFGRIVVTAAKNVSIKESAATELGAITTSNTGNLSVISTGEVTDATGQVLTITGTTTISAPGKSVVLDSANAFTDSVSVTAGSAVINQTGALKLDTSTVTGILTATAGGNITQSGALSVAGIATFKAAGFNISLTNASNAFGTISITDANNVAINESGASDLGTSKVQGSLDLTATEAITDSGALTITGNANISSPGKNATLDFVGSKFTGVINATANNLTLVNTATTGTDLGLIDLTGNLVLTSAGDVTDSDVVTVDGTTTITAATGKSVTLNDDGTANAGAVLAGAISVTGASVDIKNTVATVLGNSTATGTFSITAYNQNITSTASILSITGATTLDAGTGNISVNLTGSKLLSTLSLDGAAISVTGNSAFNLGAVTATGNLAITTTGNVTDTGTISIDGTTTINAGASGSVSLNSPANVFDGAISIVGLNATIVNTAVPTILGTITAKGALNVTSKAGEVTNTGKLTITGSASIDTYDGDLDTYQDITLNHAASTFGALILRGEDVTVVEAAATELGTSTINGNFSLTSNGSVTDSLTGKLTVVGTTTISANNFGSITLDTATSTFGGALALVAQNITLNCSGALDFGATTASGNVSVVSTGNISDSGILEVLGNISINVGTNNIVLDFVGRSFGGTILMVGGTVSY